jgi:AraC family transcriptional regulator
MEDISEDTVRRVVESIYSNFDEEFTVEDMARTAMFSKFHFTRLFRKVTGVSPARFLGAVRIQEAKRLLVCSSLSVTEISHLVGYTSVGTFSVKFRAAVGTSPSNYRALGGRPEFSVAEHGDADGRAPEENTAVVTGRVRTRHVDTARLGPIFVGLFPDRIPLGRPIRHTVLREPGPFVIDAAPPGKWYVLAYSVNDDLDAVVRAPVDEGRGFCIGAHGPRRIADGAWVNAVDLTLRPKRRIDPPVVLALLEIGRRGTRRERDRDVARSTA